MPLPWVLIAGYFLASRCYLFVVGMMSVHVFVKGPDGPRSMDPLNVFNNWDTYWYLAIAQSGYRPQENSTAFFPLYPLLLHLAGYILPDPRVAGYLLSNALLLASCFLLWKLVVRDYGREDVADRAILFLLFGPVSFFFSTIYTESLFLFLVIALAYFAGDRRWFAAGCCGYLASLTRPVGILLVLGLGAQFLFAWRQERKRGPALPHQPLHLPADTLPFLSSCLLTGAGLASYCFYLHRTFGHSFAFIRAEKHWGRHFAFPWVPFEHYRYLAFYEVWFYAAVVTAVVILVLGFVFRLRATHSVLGLVYVLFYLSTTQLEALPRFLSIIFPFYITIAMGAVRWPRLEPLFLAGSVMLLTLSTILFVNGYWFT